jgi:hypothetical protein
MVTVIARPGHVTTALLDRLAAGGREAHLYDAARDDLFLLAMKSTAIIYAEGDDAAAFDEAVTAASAPGSRRFVMVSIAGRHAERIKALRKRGVPYIVVESLGLIEDALDELATPGAGRVWVPSDFELVGASAGAVADAIVDALAAESDGATLKLEAQTVGAAEVARRLRMRPDVQASTLPRALYRLGERLGAMGKHRNVRLFEQRAA